MAVDFHFTASLTEPMAQNDDILRTIARQIATEVLGPAPFAIGDTVRALDGRMVRITAGQYWGQHGLSNHWTWQEVLPGGALGPAESGYGWRPSEA